MIKIRIIRAGDRQKIYELMQLDDKHKPDEVELALHRIDLFLFDPEQRLYKVIVAENERSELTGFAVYGPDPQGENTYQVYNLTRSPVTKNENILSQMLQYIEQDLIKYHGRMIFIEISSHLRYKEEYQIYCSQKYSISSRINNYYAQGEDKLILAKNL